MAGGIIWRCYRSFPSTIFSDPWLNNARIARLVFLMSQEAVAAAPAAHALSQAAAPDAKSVAHVSVLSQRLWVEQMETSSFSKALPTTRTQRAAGSGCNTETSIDAHVVAVVQMKLLDIT
mmetsp:Transcript_21289/g.54536  ORF Transcript_21289/g.54536 Transcript_21289/m.54536 type:complete len:120 (-) Transcript_21289:134-493(-)